MMRWEEILWFHSLHSNTISLSFFIYLPTAISEQRCLSPHGCLSPFPFGDILVIFDNNVIISYKFRSLKLTFEWSIFKGGPTCQIVIKHITFRACSMFLWWYYICLCIWRYMHSSLSSVHDGHNNEWWNW